METKKKEIPNLVEKLDAMPKSYKDNIAKNFLEEIREFIAQPGGGEYLDRRYEDMQKRKKGGKCMKYWTCPKCGASLDHGETCGCDKIKENEPPHANENGSFKRTATKKSYPNFIIKPDDCQAEPEEKYNAEKAVAAQKALCDKYGLTNFAPAFDGTCFYCGKNIYEPYSEGNKRPTGYTVEEAGRRHIFFCPHCRKSFLD